MLDKQIQKIWFKMVSDRVKLQEVYGRCSKEEKSYIQNKLEVIKELKKDREYYTSLYNVAITENDTEGEIYYLNRIESFTGAIQWKIDDIIHLLKLLVQRKKQAQN